jgi:hypothetical protein
MQLFPKDDEAKGLLARAQEAVASQPRDPMLTRARAQFAAGDVAGARATALEGGYRSYVADLDRFTTALDKGKSALKQTLDGAAALPSLDEAYRLVGSLGGSPQAAIMQDVKKPYANALYLSGTERLEKKDKCGAARDLFKAARVMPEDGKIASKVRELEDEAEQGLIKARGAKTQDAERAAAIARESLCLARTGTKTQDELKSIARF